MGKKEGSTREAAGKEAYFYKTFLFHFEFNAICVKCLNRTKNLTALAIAAITAARKKQQFCAHQTCTMPRIEQSHTYVYRL